MIFTSSLASFNSNIPIDKLGGVVFNNFKQYTSECSNSLEPATSWRKFFDITENWQQPSGKQQSMQGFSKNLPKVSIGQNLVSLFYMVLLRGPGLCSSQKNWSSFQNYTLGSISCSWKDRFSSSLLLNVYSSHYKITLPIYGVKHIMRIKQFYVMIANSNSASDQNSLDWIASLTKCQGLMRVMSWFFSLSGKTHISNKTGVSVSNLTFRLHMLPCLADSEYCRLLLKNGEFIPNPARCWLKADTTCFQAISSGSCSRSALIWKNVNRSTVTWKSVSSKGWHSLSQSLTLMAIIYQLASSHCSNIKIYDTNKAPIEPITLIGTCFYQKQMQLLLLSYSCNSNYFILKLDFQWICARMRTSISDLEGGMLTRNLGTVISFDPDTYFIHPTPSTFLTKLQMKGFQFTCINCWLFKMLSHVRLAFQQVKGISSFLEILRTVISSDSALIEWVSKISDFVLEEKARMRLAKFKFLVNFLRIYLLLGKQDILMVSGIQPVIMKTQKVMELLRALRRWGIFSRASKTTFYVSQIGTWIILFVPLRNMRNPNPVFSCLKTNKLIRFFCSYERIRQRAAENSRWEVGHVRNNYLSMLQLSLSSSVHFSSFTLPIQLELIQNNSFSSCLLVSREVLLSIFALFCKCSDYEVCSKLKLFYDPFPISLSTPADALPVSFDLFSILLPSPCSDKRALFSAFKKLNVTGPFSPSNF